MLESRKEGQIWLHFYVVVIQDPRKYRNVLRKHTNVFMPARYGRPISTPFSSATKRTLSKFHFPLPVSNFSICIFCPPETRYCLPPVSITANFILLQFTPSPPVCPEVPARIRRLCLLSAKHPCLSF